MRNELNEMDFKNLLSFRTGAVTFDNPVSIGLHGEKLEEGLIRTYPIDTTMRYIKSYFRLSNNEIFKVEGENGIWRIIVKIYDDKRNHKLLDRAMRLCGYFPAHYDRRNTDDGYVLVQYKSINDEDVSAQLRKEEQYLVHVTPTYNEEKILKMGFSPKCKNSIFNYPDRVYFSVGSTPSSEILTMLKILSTVNNSEGDTKNYTYFVVDISKISENVKFFRDQNYKNGVYTTDNIRPDCIVAKQNINVDTLN